MDADRFDALSRALTTAPSRRKTLGALLGALFASALPGSVLDPLAAAGKRTRKGRRHATRKDRRREAARLESGEVRASDVGAATHCLPPGAKPCRNGSQCCSGRCKRKKRKCLPCATGTTYCPSQEACVDSAQFDTLCTGGGTGQCTSNSDCCPVDRPGCASETLALYKFCDGGNCVCAGEARPNYPKECTFAGSPQQCHECCNNDDCVVKTGDPNRTCFFGNCGCGGDKPTLCSQRVLNGKTYCTDTTSDPENCSPFVGNCGTKCAPDWECINGTCTFPG